MPGRKLTVEDALCFMDKVKNLCDLKTYGHFLDVMTAFKANESVLDGYP
jgi:histone deacetylase complex regulatory component SIN3